MHCDTLTPDPPAGGRQAAAYLLSFSCSLSSCAELTLLAQSLQTVPCEDREDSEDVWLAALWDDDACVRDRWEEAWVAERLRDIQNMRRIRDRGDASQQTPSLPLRTPHPPL